MAEPKQQVNVDFSNDSELLKALDKMVVEDFSDRSKFIRKLVAQEIGRRQQLPLFPTQPNKTKKARKESSAVAA